MYTLVVRELQAGARASAFSGTILIRFYDMRNYSQ